MREKAESMKTQCLNLYIMKKSMKMDVSMKCRENEKEANENQCNMSVLWKPESYSMKRKYMQLEEK